MKVRPKKAASPKGPTPKPMAETFSFPAPIRGWVLNESLFAPQPGGARILDNCICGQTTVKVRKGCQKFATVGSDVTALFSHKSGSAESFFAATTSAIYDITSPADPDVAPAADVSGQASGDYSVAHFGTTGGEYIYAVNGADSPQLFDGATWTAITGASSPAITGVTTSGFSHVWSHGSRLFFVEGGTMSYWFLPVDQIAGAAQNGSLAGVFKLGGSLLFGATWSVDSGDGLDDKCVFVSTEGEVAIYSGTDPAAASAWALQGVYRITRPLGKNATMRAGGDLLIATEIGLVPLSEVFNRDLASLSLGAVSRQIEPYWQDRAARYSTIPWQIAKWPAENIMLVSQPQSALTLGTTLVANLHTGAWTRFTGCDSRSLGMFGGDAYLGSSDGVIYKLQEGGSDDGTPYTSVCLYQHSDMGMPGATKTLVQMRATFRSATAILPQLSALVDYDETVNSPPNAPSVDLTEGWDVSTWDTSLWDATSGDGVLPEDSQWVDIGVTGYAIAPEIQMTFGSVTEPDAELIGIDATYWPGALVA